MEYCVDREVRATAGQEAGATCSWYHEFMRLFVFVPQAFLLVISGCGYHALGAATHLPPEVKTLSVPVFATRTEAYHSETVMTQAVIREFATRTRLRVIPR